MSMFMAMLPPVRMLRGLPLWGRQMEKEMMKPEEDESVCRLFSQRIEGEKCEKPEEVVRWMGALQAQDYQQSLWAIGLRCREATVAGIEQAIADRKIVRTWPMRGTLHFVPAEDTKWMLVLSAARMLAQVRRRQEQLELDETIMQR